MKSSLRVFFLLIAAAGGLTAAPTQGADGTLPRDPEPVSLTGAERWSLRETKPPALAMTPRLGRFAPLASLPEERRAVRVVYQGYLEAGPLRAGTEKVATVFRDTPVLTH